MTAISCIVYGCSNKHGEGQFIGDICAPCHFMISTGEIGPSDNFIAKLNNKLLDAIKPKPLRVSPLLPRRIEFNEEDY